jgi:hypothetical protein
MAFLKKTDILKASDIKTEVVPCPEWGGDVMVYGLNGMERDGFEASVVEMRGKETSVDMANIRAKLCALAIRDEDGARLFDDDEAIDLGKKSADVLDRIFTVAQRLSGLTKEDVDKLAKN